MVAGAGVSADQIVRSPAWLPIEVVTGEAAARVVHLDEAAYQAASFLDQRLLAAPYERSACSIAILESASLRLASRPHYIFHTGHVGSTLISRLLGAHEGFFSLREPALLRTLATRSPAAATALGLPVVLALLGRTWRPNQRALVKATSFVSELAEAILGGADRPRAIFMFAMPRAYLQGIFAGPNSRLESRQLLPARQERLSRRLGGEWREEPRSEGEGIALSWLCEMSALHQAAARFAGQVVWVDFDTFLADPERGLPRIFAALDAAPSAAEIAKLVKGPLMSQYSKAPEHAYDAALRRQLLLEAERESAAEIRRGMEWLRKVAVRHALAEAVLQESRVSV